MRLLRKRERADTVVAPAGPSLARPPALIAGTILLAFGLGGFLVNADFPRDFPSGTVHGESWLGFEINGWTCFFTATAGGLLLIGAAQHVLAKAISLLVALALGACAVIALIDGDVLGLAAANGWTELGWGVASAVLLVTALLPRAARRRAAPVIEETDRTADGASEDETTVTRTGRFRRTHPVGRPAAEPV
jgi:hypothetical protein